MILAIISFDPNDPKNLLTFQLKDVTQSGSDLVMNFDFEVICSDDQKLPAPPTNLYVQDVNNKPPKFNRGNYEISGVSKRLPVGVDLLSIYPIDLFIQDIDRNANGQLTDAFEITIEGL